MTAQRSTKQGQVQLNETFLVLFIIIILLFLGLFLYSKFFFQSLEGRANTLSEQDSTVFLSKVTSLAELRCSDKPCLDTAKFLPFQALVQQQRTTYTALLGAQKISIEELYPQPTSPAYCAASLYLQPAYPGSCSKWILYEQKPSTSKSTQILSTVVSLYYPEEDLYTLGRLTLEVYR